MTTTWTPAAPAAGTWTAAPQATGSWAQVALPQPRIVDGTTWADTTWADVIWDPVTLDVWTRAS